MAPDRVTEERSELVTMYPPPVLPLPLPAHTKKAEPNKAHLRARPIMGEGEFRPPAPNSVFVRLSPSNDVFSPATARKFRGSMLTRLRDLSRL